MTDDVFERVDAIVNSYKRGIKLSPDAVIEIAKEVSTANINEVFLRLPDILKPKFKEFASDCCAGGRWIYVGSAQYRNAVTNDPPVSPETIAVLRDWLNQQTDM